MNWDQRIKNAKKENKFSLEDRKLAEDWNKCSIGERTNGSSFEPKITQHAIRWGVAFSNAVDFDDLKEAEFAHNKIKQLTDNELYVEYD